ncbi:MAG: sigma-70 family RNA polymerase sigma factor [Phycisphaera sp.]|nr:sigma-70 family RNA polymerase sigma factor [Phycisphaera sp.]
MSFPETHYSLIDRLVREGAERDWGKFLEAYWTPLCAFARRRAGLSVDDAEDVAAMTVEVLLRNKLLDRWATDRSAKLRTLLCTVVRRVMANRLRVQSGRRELLEELGRELTERDDLPTLKADDATEADVDVLYAAWVEQLLRDAVGRVVTELRADGKEHYVAVLRARVCDGLTIRDTAERVGITTASVDNHYRSMQKRLRDALQTVMHEHVRPNTPARYIDTELFREWAALAEYLESHGGLEDAIATACADVAPAENPLSDTPPDSPPDATDPPASAS